MEPERVPKSFGCFPHRSLRITLQCCKSLKSSLNNSKSPRSTANITTRPKTKTSITTREQDQLEQVFQYFDGDSDGKISAVELRAYFASIGEYMSHEEAQGVIEDLDTDGDNLIDFGDFWRLMKKEGNGNNKGEGDGDGDGDEDIKAAFQIFEFGKGSGRITSKSLQRVLSRLGDEKSQDECEAMIRAYDADGNGELDFHEFYQMMA